MSVEEVCQKIGNIDIIEANMLASDFNGASFGSEENVKILINKNIDNHHRRRFTKAHELGHTILHIFTGKQSKFQCSDNDITYNSGNNSEYEKEANIFASSLLMPSKLIEKEIHRNDLSWRLIQEIKNMCDVSLEAATRKVISLSKEPCCLIIHKDSQMWAPIKSDSFNAYINAQSFPDNLNYSKETDNFPDSLEECDAMDWRIDNKMRLHYSSIYNSEFARIMTLLLKF
ncbi:ImmA/IrrE family metallo-endopeptidase [Bathymodiolus thermophilus thioautotrophic gill symbiont]|uniref:IrrE N-terminal-like domain-containing protein n=1 Tax=Bathymodiolus thermophilus thioautotrophic gill symbiont TaxID=2360 RepID=A0A1J5UMP8_9GAMM|nr:ImmA/IrrE family metallo-endopeptidase [Bathymodiolus thermophilus thioautotrophic gill symbiont]OIR25511.1 hypothetical protein BGC33_06870 [Bathymodiolus thermophilus thioautotrophic gill symbiont]